MTDRKLNESRRGATVVLLAIVGGIAGFGAAHAAPEPSSCALQPSSLCRDALAAAQAFNENFDAGRLYYIWDNLLCSVATTKLTKEQFASGLSAYRYPMGANIVNRELFAQQLDFLDPNTNRSTYLRSYKITATVGGFYEYLGLVREGDTWKVCDYNFALAPKA